MRLAIVAEKPSILDCYSPLLPEFFPDVNFARTPVFFPVFGWFKGTANRFRLPRGLKWSELPFISQPVYRPITFTDAKAKIGVRKLVGTTYSMIESEAEQAFSDADVVLALMDAGYGGAHLAYRFISDALGYFPKGRVLFPWSLDTNALALRKSLSEMRHFDEFAMPLAMEGEIRRYFDYNYLANALPIIGEVARAAGTWGETIPSKYGLQLLYDARETGSMSDGHRIDRMSRWKGTGRYKQDTRHYFSGLGSPTSQSSIIEELIKAHYLQRTGPKRHHTELTEEGNRFLDLLHPDCEDRDLPFRLDQWSRMPVDEAQEKINRYIRTFFGKQKVFLDKTRASEAAA